MASSPARSQRLLAAGESLPRLSFRPLAGPGAIGWNQGTMASVTFVPHAGACPECARYAVALGTVAEGLREWATRAIVLLAPGMGAMGSGAFELVDEGGAGRAQLGVAAHQAAVVQADRWGAVYQVEAIGSGDGAHGDLPAPADLVALAQFIDIQCPECGIPSKEWLSSSPFPLG